MGNKGCLFNRSQNCVLAETAECVSGHGWHAFSGLMGRAHVPANVALGFCPCDWVHTWGMRVPLDLLFCGPDDRVLRVVERVPPCRVPARVLGAATVWEMASGGFCANVSPGDWVVLE